MTNLPQESIPKIQVRKYTEAKKHHRAWAKPYGNKEEPLIVVSDEEMKQFQTDRRWDLLWYAGKSLLWGSWDTLASPLYNVLSIFGRSDLAGGTGCVAPSSDQLDYWFSHTSMALQVHRKHLCLAPYQDMTTLDPDAMKSCGTRVELFPNGRVKSIQLIILETGKAAVKFSVQESDLAWSAAKLLLMHNLNHQLVLHEHPKLHVTAATLCSLLRTEISDSHHPLRRFLDPHFKYTLAITNLVINDSSSILLNHQSPFSPFDISFETMNQFHLQMAHKHLELHIGNMYQTDTFHSQTPYGKMMNEYWNVMDHWTDIFVSKYLERLLSQDPYVHRWWHAIRQHFTSQHLTPWNETKELNVETLKQVLTSIVFLVSIQHSTDHWLYSRIPAPFKPWRWNGPLPSGPQDATSSAHLHAIDIFQAGATNHMFFTNVPQVPLRQVQYEDCPMDNAYLYTELERIYAEFRLVPSCKIACSIDW